MWSPPDLAGEPKQRAEKGTLRTARIKATGAQRRPCFFALPFAHAPSTRSTRFFCNCGRTAPSCCWFWRTSRARATAKPLPSPTRKHYRSRQTRRQTPRLPWRRDKCKRGAVAPRTARHPQRRRFFAKNVYKRVRPPLQRGRVKLATLAYVKRDGHTLMLHKARGYQTGK